jgi:hypothetical protein
MNTELKVPNLDALEMKLGELIGIRPRLKGEIRITGREKPYLHIESEEMKGVAGVLSGGFKSLKLSTFNSSYNAEHGFWMTVYWRWDFVIGGSNGVEVLTAWCSTDGTWIFK